MTAPIIEKIKSADNLPSLPTVAIQVMKMTQADDVSIPQIASVIQQDPALTVKILKVVNSSLFGMSRKIATLNQAMMVLGLRTVKVMVLSFSLVDTMTAKREGDLDYPGYWRRSLTTAVAARVIGERVNRALSDEAFVAGLLSDLGILASFHCAQDSYKPVIAAMNKGQGSLEEVEARILGTTHEQIGAELLEHWGLPEALSVAVGSHHHPVNDAVPANLAEHETLVKILRSAAMISGLFCLDLKPDKLEECVQHISSSLELEKSVLEEVLEALDHHVKEAASLFALKITPPRAYQELQAEAVAQLTQLSMAAELERAQSAQRVEAVQKEVQQLNDQNRELAHQAKTDALTGVANRAGFEEHLRIQCGKAMMEGTCISLLILDLDRFKKLNDTFGHQTGDEALRLVGKCLQQLQKPAIMPARYGGEEFAVIISALSIDDVRTFSEEVRVQVSELRIPHGRKEITITASIGLAHMAPDDPELTPAKLIARADQCLYAAKNRGRNRVVAVDSADSSELTAAAR